MVMASASFGERQNPILPPCLSLATFTRNGIHSFCICLKLPSFAIAVCCSSARISLSGEKVREAMSNFLLTYVDGTPLLKDDSAARTSCIHAISFVRRKIAALAGPEITCRLGHLLRVQHNMTIAPETAWPKVLRQDGSVVVDAEKTLRSNGYQYSNSLFISSRREEDISEELGYGPPQNKKSQTSSVNCSGFTEEWLTVHYSLIHLQKLASDQTFSILDLHSRKLSNNHGSLIKTTFVDYFLSLIKLISHNLKRQDPFILDTKFGPEGWLRLQVMKGHVIIRRITGNTGYNTSTLFINSTKQVGSSALRDSLCTQAFVCPYIVSGLNVAAARKCYLGSQGRLSSESATSSLEGAEAETGKKLRRRQGRRRRPE
nr:hypothetical protein CR513_29137 [Ipomoea batatas]